MLRDSGILGTARAVTVLILYLTKAFRAMNQPWGGAMAIRRALFQELRVEELWRFTVVDDVTLAGRLAQVGIATALSHGACLSTSVVEPGLNAFTDWMDRQWLYLKFVFPAQWVAAGINQYVLAGLMMLSLLNVLGWFAGWSSATLALGGVGFLLGGASFAWMLRRLHPEPGAPISWILGVFLSIFMSAWSHGRTLWTRTVDWKGIRYHVGAGGRVLGMERQGPSGQDES
jgi:hypothetical protein